jgi:hypothetical protein
MTKNELKELGLDNLVEYADSLQVQNEQLKKLTEDQAAEIEGHVKRADELQAIGEDLQTQMDNLARMKKGGLSHDDVQEIVLRQAEEIAQLQLQVAGSVGLELKKKTVPQKPVIPKELVTIDDKKYKFKLAAFHFGGKSYTAEEAAFNQDLLKTIVALKGQGILKEVI